MLMLQFKRAAYAHAVLSHDDTEAIVSMYVHAVVSPHFF